MLRWWGVRLLSKVLWLPVISHQRRYRYNYRWVLAVRDRSFSYGMGESWWDWLGGGEVMKWLLRGGGYPKISEKEGDRAKMGKIAVVSFTGRYVSKTG